MRTLKTAKQVVDALGGHEEVCKLMKAKPKASYYWVGQAGAFPSRLYVKMTNALERRGYKASPALWSMQDYDEKV
jgi:hypothetical protein